MRENYSQRGNFLLNYSYGKFYMSIYIYSTLHIISTVERYYIIIPFIEIAATLTHIAAIAVLTEFRKITRIHHEADR